MTLEIGDHGSGRVIYKVDGPDWNYTVLKLTAEVFLKTERSFDWKHTFCGSIGPFEIESTRKLYGLVTECIRSFNAVFTNKLYGLETECIRSRNESIRRKYTVRFFSVKFTTFFENRRMDADMDTASNCCSPSSDRHYFEFSR